MKAQLIQIEPEWTEPEEESDKVKELLKLNYLVVRLRTSYWQGSDNSINMQRKCYPLYSKSNPNVIDQFFEDIQNVGVEDMFMFDDKMKDGLYAINIITNKCWTDCGYEYDCEYDVSEYEN